MAYNIPERYSDLTPAAKLDKKTLNKMVWMSCFLQASFNYERMQACGWLWGILPGLKKIHTNKEDLKASMAHNLDFLNTHPFLVTFVMGIVLSLEDVYKRQTMHSHSIWTMSMKTHSLDLITSLLHRYLHYSNLYHMI